MQKFRTDGKRIPVTVVEVEKNPVIAVQTAEKNGYFAVQIGYGTAKKPSRPLAGHIKGANTEKAPQFLREVRFMDAKSADDMPKVGDFISLADVLEAGDVIDVTGTSKGKGFAGGVKRYHFKGGPRTHGQSDRERAPGSVGQTTTPGRVYKGKRMAGKMGFETVTVQNLTVAGVTGDTLFIEGLVPGKLGALVTITKKNTKDKKYADLIEVAEAKKIAEEEATKKAEAEKQAQEAAQKQAEETKEEPKPEEGKEEKVEEAKPEEAAQAEEQKVEETK